MKLRIDIPIFAGPNAAWGNAVGDIEAPDIPKAGDFLTLSIGPPELLELGFPSSMLVSSVTSGEGGLLVLLDGVVAPDRAAATRIGQIFESEMGWDIWEYE